MVSNIVSTTRTRSPSISVTSLARCLSTGSPKVRIVYGTTTPRVPTPCLCVDPWIRPVRAQTRPRSHASGIDGDPEPTRCSRAGEVDVGEAIAELLHRWRAHEGA